MVLTMWFPRPCDMKPAPIRATRMGRPSFSRAFSALSTRIMLKFLQHYLRSYLPVFARTHSGRFLLPLAHAPFDLGSLFVQQLPDCILLRNHRYRQRPLQSQLGIVVHQPAFGARSVELPDLVAGLSLVPQHLVAVREAFRHIERAVVVFAQFDGHVLQVSRAFRPEIDNDVEDRAPGGAHQLGFGCRWKLEVHAAQRSLLVIEGNVGLRDHRLQTVLLELMLAEGAGEKPARILSALDVDDERAFQFCFRENHLDHFPFVLPDLASLLWSPSVRARPPARPRSSAIPRPAAC